MEVNVIKKAAEWSIQRKIESLKQMDEYLLEIGSTGRHQIWQEWGGGLMETAEKTQEKWKLIASNDELYEDAVFCFMVCVLSKYATLNIFG